MARSYHYIHLMIYVRIWCMAREVVVENYRVLVTDETGRAVGAALALYFEGSQYEHLVVGN